jgi:hypothetical protein
MKALALLVGIIAIISAFMAWDIQRMKEGRPPSSPWHEAPKVNPVAADNTVYRYACEIVKSNLKAPRTAIFGRLEDGDAYIIRHPNNVVEIYSFVDSENSFGAMIRQKWRIGAFAHNERFTNAFYLQISDRELGDYGDIKRYAEGRQATLDASTPASSQFNAQ